MLYSSEVRPRPLSRSKHSTRAGSPLDARTSLPSLNQSFLPESVRQGLLGNLLKSQRESLRNSPVKKGIGQAFDNMEEERRHLTEKRRAPALLRERQRSVTGRGL